MDTKLSKSNIHKKELTILLSVLLFLIFAYYGGNLKWMGDFQLFIDLLASIFAFFIGVLALVRFYTKKSSLNFLFLGLGFLSVGLIESLQIFASLGTFTELFTLRTNDVFPTTTVISRLFLSLVLLGSWLLMREEYREKVLNEKIAFVAVAFTATLVTVFVSLYTQIFANYQGYTFAIIGQTVAMFIFLLALLGYLRSKGIFFRSFDFWLTFSLVFALISQIFYLPYLNLEYQLMLNLGTLAKFLSYMVLLIGFLNSVYEMYKREEEYQKELVKKNLILKETKKKVEEAYMLLRSEKWKLTKEKEKDTADKIMQDILKNT